MQNQISTVHKQLQRCVLQIESLAAGQERHRIAQDLHDSLGYALTALNIQLQTAERLLQLDPEQAQIFLAKAQQLGFVAVQEVRQTVGSLRANNFEGKTLELLI